MGRMDLTDFQKQADVDIRAVCDAFRPSADQARQMTGGRAEPLPTSAACWKGRTSTPS
jgi:hypothetical protein